MPFILPWRRKALDEEGVADFQPGDRCYLYYREMVEQWKAEPRWTTAHNIYKSTVLEPCFDSDDEVAAAHLAWQVFFALHVMPYEEQKRKENGDI